MRSHDKSDWLIALISLVLHVSLGGWMFMLAVGVVRGDWIAQCPTIGFFDACLIAALIRGALYTYESKE